MTDPSTLSTTTHMPVGGVRSTPSTDPQSSKPNATTKGEGNRVKRTHKKSRNGCVTCKTHRVKCDERIPICHRCERLGRTCIRPEDKKAKVSQRPLASVARRPLQPFVPIQILTQPSQTLFDSDREYRYYLLFSEKVAITLSPYFYKSEWSRMILQACATEWTIRQVAIAIAALDLTLNSGFRGQDPGFAKSWRDARRLPPPGCGDFAQSETARTKAAGHHRYALEQYGKAVKQMRINIAKGETDIRVLLLTCIITTCFEIMHGNHEAACSQLHTGLLLFQDWRDRQSNSEKHPLGFSSPQPKVVDDYLAQTFGRMEIQSMTYYDRRPIECHSVLHDEANRTISAMPTTFRSLDEARVYLDLTMRRQMHFMGTITRTFIKYAFFPPEDETSLIFGDVDDHQSMTDAQIRKECIEMYKESLRWSSAFQPFLDKLNLPVVSNEEKITILTMNIAAVASRICSSGVLTGLETRYDVNIKQFRQVVDQCALLLAMQEIENAKYDRRSQSGPSFVFSFELGVITPLSLTCIKCRDPRIRRDALDLLCKYPRREGVWDSVITAALSRWAISMEEGWEGLDDPWDGEKEIWLPENKRLRGVSVRYDLMHKKVVISGLQWHAGEARWIMQSDDYMCETWKLDEYFGCWQDDQPEDGQVTL